MFARELMSRGSPIKNSSDRWIERKAAAAIFPEQTATTLLSVQENWPADAPPFRAFIESFPLGEENLLHLLSVSSICAARVVNAPDILIWLADACQSSRGYGRML